MKAILKPFLGISPILGITALLALLAFPLSGVSHGSTSASFGVFIHADSAAHRPVVPATTLERYLPTLTSFLMQPPLNSGDSESTRISWSGTKAIYTLDSTTIVVSIYDYNHRKDLAEIFTGYMSGKANIVSDNETIQSETIGQYPGWTRTVLTDRPYAYAGVALSNGIYVQIEYSQSKNAADAKAILLRMDLAGLSGLGYGISSAR